MALSEKWVLEKARELLWNPRYTGFNPVAFARSVEAEVRRQDDELIRQLVGVLESVDGAMPFPVARQVLKVARARLEGKSNE